MRGSFRHEMMKKFVVIVRMSAISIIMMRVVLSACVPITFGCEILHYGVLHRKLLSFRCKRQKTNGFAEMLDNIYIYIYISGDVRSNVNALLGTSLLLGGTRNAYHS